MVEEMLQKFLCYYNGFESWPVFDNVEEMLKWSGLYEFTQRMLEEELVDASSETISELVTVIKDILFNSMQPASRNNARISADSSSSESRVPEPNNFQAH